MAPTIRRKLHDYASAHGLTPAQLRKAKDRCHADSSRVNDALIERGDGHKPLSAIRQMAKDGDALAALCGALCDELHALAYEERRRYGPGS